MPLTITILIVLVLEIGIIDLINNMIINNFNSSRRVISLETPFLSDVFLFEKLIL